MALLEALQRLSRRQHLSSDTAAAAFGVVMRGEATHEQIRDLLLGLKQKGETADEVAGAASALRATMIRVPGARGPWPEAPLVDTCGTGGGTVTTFNISTTAVFVAAGAGVPIAKHGNRSFTSRSGSADVLEALGVGIALSPERAVEVLDAVGLVFLFAPHYHPAMKHAAPVRKELKTTTIFNLLGPLANPAGVTRQVIGVPDRERGALIAEALLRLGAEHALVVHAEVGMDEISPAGVTRVWEVGGPQATGVGPREWVLDPDTYGLAVSDLAALKGGEPSENAERLERLLADPTGDPAGRAAVLLNAAAAIYVSGVVPTFAEAVSLASESLDTGKGAAILAALKEASR
ncbi:MAG: anthranilate phosphoribosyltransferase [Gemmatimonadetes bacterium]|nr:anthranilate phosphoribosyltransferase [Gemmatimonadota bacterium]